MASPYEINEFTISNNINSVVDFGCGDGHQLSLFKFKNYIGLDISEESVSICKRKFKNDKYKTFMVYENDINLSAELAISLDVIYHVTDDIMYKKYMQDLFRSAALFVIIYSTNYDEEYSGNHIKHRNVINWIQNNINLWKLIKVIKNRYPADSKSNFYIYQKILTRI